MAAEIALLAAFRELHLTAAVRACSPDPPVILNAHILTPILRLSHQILKEGVGNGIGAGVYRIFPKAIGFVASDPDQLPDDRLGRNTTPEGEGYEPSYGLVL